MGSSPAGQPHPHTALPPLWGRASPLQPPPTAQLLHPAEPDPPAAASHEQQLCGGHVLLIPNKHTLYISEVKDFIIPWVFSKK